MKNNISPLFTFVILVILFAACSRKTDPDLNEEVKKQILLTSLAVSSFMRSISKMNLAFSFCQRIED
jgi:hypothetical protein